METALFDFTVLQIGDREDSWVLEDRGRKLEGHSVLPQVRGGLGFVPLELKLPVIQNSFSHIVLQRAVFLGK